MIFTSNDYYFFWKLQLNYTELLQNGQGSDVLQKNIMNMQTG